LAEKPLGPKHQTKTRKANLQIQQAETMARLIMRLSKVILRLHEEGLTISIERRLPTNLGYQIVTQRGHVINVYDSQTIDIQGKHKEEMGKLLTKEQK
jgi:hypothetical protein